MKDIEKIDKCIKKDVRNVYNSLCVYVCVGYICVLLCVDIQLIFSMCVYEDTCATQQIWGCFLDIRSAMYNQSHERLTE